MFRSRISPRMLLLTLAILVSLAVSTGTTNASGKLVLKEHKAVGPYTVALVIGPALPISIHRTKTGEMMLGGKSPKCKIGTMGHGKACNRHVEIHVYKKTKVITNATVKITMVNKVSHATIHVPIATFEGPQGLIDFHYGNDVFAPAGHYSVQVGVNKVSTTFSVFIRK